MLTMLTCVNEVTVVLAQIGDNSVIEKATAQAPEKAIEETTENTMQKFAAKAAQEETDQAELKAKRPEALKGQPLYISCCSSWISMTLMMRPKISPPMCICLFAEKTSAWPNPKGGRVKR